MGALLICVALWMILGSRKERLKDAKPVETVSPYGNGAGGEEVKDMSSATASRPVNIEEFNPYPGPSDS